MYLPAFPHGGRACFHDLKPDFRASQYNLVWNSRLGMSIHHYIPFTLDSNAKFVEEDHCSRLSFITSDGLHDHSKQVVV